MICALSLVICKRFRHVIAACSGRFAHSITARYGAVRVEPGFSHARTPCCTLGGYCQQPRPESGKEQKAVAKIRAPHNAVRISCGRPSMVSAPGGIGTRITTRAWRAHRVSSRSRAVRTPARSNAEACSRSSPIIEREEPTVLLTKRSEEMPTCRTNQFSRRTFPRGRHVAGRYCLTRVRRGNGHRR